jgi:hypothetical protein
MARRIPIPLVLVLVCVLLLAGGVLAADGFFIPRSVIGGGGQPATGTGIVLHGTVGEPIAGNLSLQNPYGLSSGFWWPRPYSVYLPLVQRN